MPIAHSAVSLSLLYTPANSSNDGLRVRRRHLAASSDVDLNCATEPTSITEEDTVSVGAREFSHPGYGFRIDPATGALIAATEHWAEASASLGRAQDGVAFRQQSKPLGFDVSEFTLYAGLLR